MAKSDLQSESVSDNPKSDSWRHVTDCAASAVGNPFRRERDAASLMVATEIMLRTMMCRGASAGQAKRLLITMRPGDIGILERSEIVALIKRLGLEAA